MSAPPIFIRGYAAPFNEWTWLEKGRERERIAPGAFDLSRPVDFRVLHEGAPAAWTSNGSLTLFQDGFGLGFEAAVDNASAVWGMVPSINRGEIGVSVMMRTDWTHATTHDAGVTSRTIERTPLLHVALAGVPAYENTPVWLSSWDIEDLPARLRASACRWSVGMQRERLRAYNRGSPGRQSSQAANLGPTNTVHRAPRSWARPDRVSRIDALLQLRPSRAEEARAMEHLKHGAHAVRGSCTPVISQMTAPCFGRQIAAVAIGRPL